MHGGLSKGIYRYDSVYQEGQARKRYHAFVLANEGTDKQWPGEWWSEVYPPWGNDSVSENMLQEWLEKEFPNKSWAIQEVVWIAEPVCWRESNGNRTYLDRDWDLR